MWSPFPSYVYTLVDTYNPLSTYSFPMTPLPVAKPLSGTSKSTKGNDKRKCHIDAENKNEYASDNSASSPAPPQPSVGK